MGQKAHLTAMAGEFHVMESLFRLGYEPALTLGSAKSIDILVKTSSDELYAISVKSIRKFGKWGVGKEDYSSGEKDRKMIFVFLHYKSFSDLDKPPEAWVIPAQDVERLKRPWHRDTFAVYCSNEKDRKELEGYKSAWEKYLK